MSGLQQDAAKRHSFPRDDAVQSRYSGAGGPSVAESSVTHAGARIRAALFIAFAITLLWPAAIDGSALMFFDSPGYFNQGGKAFDIGSAMLNGADGRAASAQTAGKTTEDAITVRSVAYSVVSYIAGRSIIGTYGIALLQAALAASLIATLFSRHIAAAPIATAGVLAVMVVATSLPWFASYLMPDIFAGLVLLIAVIVVQRGQSVTRGQAALLGAVAAFAAASHYSHIPISLAIGVIALAILAAGRRLTAPAALVLIAPSLVAAAFNVTVSAVVFKEPSATPQRLPFLLARSIADGPAKWHLQKNCATERYAICELFIDFPDDLNQFLFGPTGIMQRASAEQMRRIRDEEQTIVLRALADYPAQQIWSFSRNAVLQTVLFGTGDFHWSDIRIEQDPVRLTITSYDESVPRPILDAFEALQYVIVASSVALILFFGLRDGLRRGWKNRELLLVVAAGLAINAVICGGLSAPADRYQGRMIWLLPLLAGLFWIERLDKKTVAPVHQSTRSSA